MNILHVFDQAFHGLEINYMKYIYITIDIHDTILKGYSKDTIWLGKSKECLQYISSHSDIFRIILWSCLNNAELQKVSDELYRNDIKVYDINNNDHPKSVKGKFYTNILIDDRAGFEADKDWELILKYLKNKFNGTEC